MAIGDKIDCGGCGRTYFESVWLHVCETPGPPSGIVPKIVRRVPTVDSDVSTSRTEYQREYGRERRAKDKLIASVGLDFQHRAAQLADDGVRVFM